MIYENAQKQIKLTFDRALTQAHMVLQQDQRRPVYSHVYLFGARPEA